MNEFKFILSKKKFGYDVEDTIYTAKLTSYNEYIVRWETKDGWEGVEYSKADVEENVNDGYWEVIE